MARRSYNASDNGIVITLNNPLCFTGAATGTNTISMTSYSDLNVTLYYSYDNITYYKWEKTINGSNYVFNSITLSYGQSLYVFGENTRMSNFIGAQYRASTFTMSGRIAASGNVQSLLSSGIPSGITTYCYYKLFYGCTSLTTAPTLPAETLATYCYSYMFSGCTSLTTAPTLPAQTLASSCYEYMFRSCTSLTTAPALSAQTLANHCYSSMFYGCTALTTAPTLPAETLATYCYSYMFRGCTSLITAPTLPAQTLVSNCYQNMFYSCSNLTSVTIGITSWNTSYASNWLYNVAQSGTIYKPSALVNIPESSASGIPNGWSAIDV